MIDSHIVQDLIKLVTLFTHDNALSGTELYSNLVFGKKKLQQQTRKSCHCRTPLQQWQSATRICGQKFAKWAFNLLYCCKKYIFYPLYCCKKCIFDLFIFAIKIYIFDSLYCCKNISLFHCIAVKIYIFNPLYCCKKIYL